MGVDILKGVMGCGIEALAGAGAARYQQHRRGLRR